MKTVRECLVIGSMMAAACAPHGTPPRSAPSQAVGSASPALVPIPARIESLPGSGVTIGPQTFIVASPGPAVGSIAATLATFFKQTTGLAVPVTQGIAPSNPASTIVLSLDSNAPFGDEGYELSTAGPNALLKARTPAGLFYGVQTLRQLLPYWCEYRAAMFLQAKPLTLRAVHVVDSPRYPWRGAMLDVARHFFGVEDVKRFVDLLALHKMNRLHLHLADDQGWRIEIKKRPELTARGATTQVGGGPGGFYTQAQFAEIVAYAADRFITVVPEIDMPGHTNAALASVPELNCNGRSPDLFSGTDVGFSAMCVEKESTYQFIDDIVSEIAAMTPGAYFHVGGDEVKTLTPGQYKTFVERVQTIVQAHGKQMIGWDEVAATNLASGSIVQHWRPDAPHADLARAPHVIVSPANRAYLDMKYDANTMLGLNWAGLIPVQTAYDWDPATLVPEAPASVIIGVEAPLWSETVATMREVEFLLMPRLAAIAEVGWSPSAQHEWSSFRARLGAQAPRWTALGVNFYRAPEVPWHSGQ
ncbi:MAG TPA: beta-N-acetylhexosaminidase [Vicinamibacterales bacterium]|nr:beta-N-acetylhexosaminidase [Vicinamibacterales bacterium]